MDLARKIEGLPRHSSTHAAGVVIGDRPLDEHVALTRDDLSDPHAAVVAQCDMSAIYEVGLLKMDFLGLKTLTVMHDAEQYARWRVPEFKLDSVPLDDRETLDLLNRGDTMGVFQLESGGMVDTCRRYGIQKIEDIIDLLALYRPGAMQFMDEMIEVKKGLRQVEYEHPLLEQVSGETYGVMIYQEQVQAAAKLLAGYTLGGADLLRRAMGKKDPAKMAKEKAHFVEGCWKTNQIDEKTATAIFDKIEKFAGYGFNKSHSACYGHISYWTAYLKANYPAEYMAGLLTSVGDDKDKSAIYLADCRKMGITVLPPDVNESQPNFAAVGTDIRFGLAAIRNVGAGVVESIIASRTEKGKFTSFSDYLAKIDVGACNKKVTESLIKAGAFDSLEHPRKGLFLVHADAVDSVLGTKKAEAMGQFDLFGDMGGGEAAAEVFAVRVPDEEWESKHKLALEREMLGLYVSGHPLAGVEHAISAQTDTSITSLLEGEVADGAQITIGGIISSVNRRVNKKGESWAAVTIEDLVGGVEVYFFPRAYSAFGMDIAQDNIVLVRAQVRARDDGLMIAANDLAVPDLKAVGATKPVALTISARLCTPDRVTDLKQVLSRHPGPADVHVTLVSEQRSTVLRLNESLRVTPSSALMGDLKALLGPACLGA